MRLDSVRKGIKVYGFGKKDYEGISKGRTVCAKFTVQAGFRLNCLEPGRRCKQQIKERILQIY